VVAISYGKASNNNYKDQPGFVTPQMVASIPEIIQAPKPGPLELVEEIASETKYYDGETKLNTIKVNCKLYTNPNDCVHVSSCGI
jgi:hypothetical protein